VQEDLNSPSGIIAEVSSTLGINFHVLAEPLKRGSNSDYEIQSEDGKNRWCLRIPLNADAASFGNRGIAIIKGVKQRLPALPVPTVIYQSSHFTVMEYLNGRILKSWSARSLAKEQRLLLQDDLAAFLFSVWVLGVEKDPQGTGIFRIKVLEGW
jgi:aminoglycoside phosphotransferase (APT) family kinase protein